MLRKLIGVAAGVALLSVVPVSFHAPEAGGTPAPTVSDLSCSETELCCQQVNSLCMATGNPEVDRKESTGGRCPVTR